MLNLVLFGKKGLKKLPFILFNINYKIFFSFVSPTIEDAGNLGQGGQGRWKLTLLTSLPTKGPLLVEPPLPCRARLPLGSEIAIPSNYSISTFFYYSISTLADYE